MKVLSIAIPCYNSQDYMRKCIDSLLAGKDDVEILVVNDGSEDNTAAIAQEYVTKYPDIVRLINKENGGHGSAVNAGIDHAAGIFFKVVDSDDWVKESAYLAILARLKELVGGSRVIDMFISNFVYEKVGEKHHKVMSYRRVLPQDEIFTWNEVRHFRVSNYLLMHSVIFRTQLLRECGLRLPEHTFYVDNLFVFEPLVYVKNMYYLDVNFYRYYIGREDQSVNEQVMISRIDQQIRVNKLMVDYLVQIQKKPLHKKLRRYMITYLDLITTVSSIMLIRSGTGENLDKKKELWDYIKKKDRALFLRLRFGILGSATNLPGRGGRRITVDGYKLCQKIFKFN